MRSTAALLIGILSIPSLAMGANPTTGEVATRATQLVRLLGSPQYREREEASLGLLKLGTAAIPFLKEARLSEDLEVRTRAEMILPRIVEMELQQKLEQFSADTNGTAQHDILGWDRFSQITGNTAKSRQQYIEIIKSKSHFQAIRSFYEETPTQTWSRLLNPNGQVVVQNALPRPRLAANSLDLITHLFVASMLDSKNGDANQNQSNSLIYSTVIQGSFRNNLVQKDDLSLKLLANWMNTRQDMMGSYYSFLIAQNLDRSEIPPIHYALRLLKVEDKARSSTLKINALRYVSSKGFKHLTDVAEHLDDKTPIFPVRLNGQVVNIEVRDYVLTLILKMHRESVADYGFLDSNMNTSVEYMKHYFPTDKARAAALRSFPVKLSLVYLRALGILGQVRLA